MKIRGVRGVQSTVSPPYTHRESQSRYGIFPVDFYLLQTLNKIRPSNIPSIDNNPLPTSQISLPFIAGPSLTGNRVSYSSVSRNYSLKKELAKHNLENSNSEIKSPSFLKNRHLNGVSIEPPSLKR